MGDGPASSGCPVNHGTRSGASDDISSEKAAKAASFWGSFFSSNDQRPAQSSTSTAPDNASCPAQTSEKETGKVVVPSSEEAERHAQTPQYADQSVWLDTVRQVSSIPRGSTSSTTPTPSHQPATTATAHVGASSKDDENSPKWVYPSEQQMYNAMRKKGWSNVPQDSIPTVLQIHNSINERTWRQIQEWEGNPGSLHLVSFTGRPRDVSPKAYFLCHLLRLYDPPFDRHDWFVERGDGGKNESSTVASSSESQQPLERLRQFLVPTSPQRYVIDYYYLPPTHPDQPPIPYVDARPALDHPRALWLHTRRFLQHAFPGITAYLQQQRQK